MLWRCDGSPSYTSNSSASSSADIEALLSLVISYKMRGSSCSFLFVEQSLFSFVGTILQHAYSAPIKTRSDVRGSMQGCCISGD